MIALRFIIVASALLFFVGDSYQLFPSSVSSSIRILRQYSLKSTWQEDLDKILDVDTSCDSRRSLTNSFVKRLREVSEDVRQAVEDRNVEKIAPKNLQYGRAVQGFQKFQNQLLSDVIPEIFTKAVPKLLEDSPKIISRLVEKGPAVILENGQKVLERAREVSQDPSALQSTVDELRTELKNIVKSTPIGLETPHYDVLLKKEDQFEIRRYVQYSIATIKYDAKDDSSTSSSSSSSFSSSDEIPVDNYTGADAFQRLAGYIFGENSLYGKSQALKMTVPVLMDSQSMSFILPDNLDATNAPIPDSDQIDFKDVPSEIVAAREFSGLVTEGEIRRQKAKLEEYLFDSGIVYDSKSFKVLQYNPPQTIPWIRRNEIICRVTYHASSSNMASDREGSSSTESQESSQGRSANEDNEKFYAAPEAGD